MIQIKSSDFFWIQYVIKLAKANVNDDEIPIASAIVKHDQLITSSVNMMESLSNPIMHSEIICIINACKLMNVKYLYDLTIYCSHEPCKLCMEAIKVARVSRIVFSSFSFDKESQNSDPDIIGGIFWQEGAILSDFFRHVRKNKHKCR